MRSRAAPTQQTERQLAAVVAADVAGYSRLMGADEEGTLAALKACRSELIDPTIARHRGRIVKTTGDGLLIEFSSPVEAVRWAVGMQQGMIDRNADIPGERRIRFRVGINLGDVIVDGTDIFGDAVNIAARLEALADPGGIYISQTVHDQIRDRLALPFVDAGEQSVKNIARPVRVYALSTDSIAALPRMAPPALPQPANSPPWRRSLVAIAAAATLLIVAGGIWWVLPSPNMSPAIATAPPVPKRPAVPAQAPHFSIVVLPFTNMSGDKDQEYFANGITEDLTTDLSRIRDSFVISRNTAFTYKDKLVDTKQIGRDLAVRYVLEGSVQRTGTRVRINAQLIDAETDAHVWADRFDDDIAELFALQDEIVSRLAYALSLALITAEATRASEKPDVLDCVYRGLNAWNKSAEAIDWFERALALDPNSLTAKSWLALALAGRVLRQTSDPPAVAADITRAQGLIGQVLAVEARNVIAHFARAQLLRYKGNIEEAISEYEMVIANNRNSPIPIAILGWCKFITGSLDAMIPAQERAIRLSPRDPLVSSWYLWIGQAHLLQSRTDEAVDWFEQSRRANPAFPPVHSYLAAAYALKGESEHAATELAEARRLTRDDRLSSIARLRAAGLNGADTGYWGVPKVKTLFETTYFVGLRKAGIPEN